MPPMPIARPAACAAGAVYPECKWAMPDTHEVGGLYTRWRNTIDEHTWGRPALVGVMLATAHAFRARFPNQELLVGDLDAPGPRHVTHKTGVDVDLYLPNTLLVENLGARRYRPNYRTMSNVNIEHARHRVEALARILAVCTEGRVRIYYNDITVRDRFHAWFDARGLVTPFGRPMQRHNPLHDFHFHVSIGEDTPVPPLLAPFTGEHPIREIDAPPVIEGVTVFAPREEPAPAPRCPLSVSSWAGARPSRCAPTRRSGRPARPARGAAGCCGTATPPSGGTARRPPRWPRSRRAPARWLR
jgi:hypothetical protein